ncbi:hypothetical protein BH23BAC1_BH23BAC1_35380 [soil metagenome]
MAYTYKNAKGDKYYLHKKENTGRGNEGEIFFFSKEEGKDTLDKLPQGYEVVENDRSGLPVLKKS